MPRSEPDNLVDAQAAAHLVAHLRGGTCAPGTIWSWASRGHITRHGRGRYDIREIEAWTRRLMMDDLIAWLRAQIDDDERKVAAMEREEHRVQTAPVFQGHPPNWLAGVDIFVSPKRWRAEVDAKRRILDAHPTYGDYGEHCATCRHPDDELAAGEPWPCTTVRLLAEPYAGQPGWRTEWANLTTP